MKDEHFAITIVVNGQPVDVEAGLDKEIEDAVKYALKKTGNTGQPPERWELRDDSGHPIDTSKTFGALGIKPGAKLFLNLKAGVGGSSV